MEWLDAPTRHAVVAAYARVLAASGAGREARPLVLPNGEYFPDAFRADRAGIQRLLERVLEHAGLTDMAIEAQLANDEQEEQAGCAPQACGCAPAQATGAVRLVDAGEHWQLNVHPAELVHPVVLTTALVRGVASAHLLESPLARSEPDPEASVDLLATALGFGVLLLEGSYLYRKSCGGPSVARVTALSPAELALGFALFVRRGGHSARRARACLSATQRAVFDEALALVDSNRALVTRLASDAEALGRGEFVLSDASSWLGRWWRGRARAAATLDDESVLGELEAALTRTARTRPAAAPVRDAKFEEIRRLVDEALDER